MNIDKFEHLFDQAIRNPLLHQPWPSRSGWYLFMSDGTWHMVYFYARKGVRRPRGTALKSPKHWRNGKFCRLLGPGVLRELDKLCTIILITDRSAYGICLAIESALHENLSPNNRNMDR
jgi:hypothetical protein